MNKEDKLVITIVILGILYLISIITIIVLVTICNDLKDTTDMYKNTIGVCNIDLKQVQNENEKLREQINER